MTDAVERAMQNFKYHLRRVEREPWLVSTNELSCCDCPASDFCYGQETSIVIEERRNDE